MRLSYTALERDGGRTVLSILRHELEMSAALIRRLKQARGICVSGEPVYVNHTVSPGETVTADITAAEPPCGNVPERGDIEILFENEGLISVNKPAGILVHPSRARNTGTLANFVAGYLEETAGMPCCHAVNRLDRDTSGVVLFAKNSHMKARAAKALSKPEAVREYAAVVCGVTPECGTFDVPIKRLEERNMLRTAASDGQRAVTHYVRERVIETEAGNISLLRLRLETGRTHQIRVHLHHAGLPVLGDTLYSTEESRRVSGALGITAQLLHAARLGFCEPLSREYVLITAGEPECFQFVHQSKTDVL